MLSTTSSIKRFPGGITAFGVRLTPGLEMLGHCHDQHVMTLVVTGTLVIESNGIRLSLCAGNGALCWSGRSRDIKAGPEGAECIVLSAIGRQPVGSHPFWRACRRRLYQLCSADAPSQWAAIVNGVLADEPVDMEACWLALFAHWHNGRTSGTAVNIVAERARLLLSTATARMTTRDVARVLCVNPAHLARVFRRHYGLSIRDFVTQRRADESRRLLDASELTIGEVAYATGFADHSHLTRVFHGRFGVSPSVYRRAPFRQVATVQDGIVPGAHVGKVRDPSD